MCVKKTGSERGKSSLFVLGFSTTTHGQKRIRGPPMREHTSPDQLWVQWGVEVGGVMRTNLQFDVDADEDQWPATLRGVVWSGAEKRPIDAVRYFCLEPLSLSLSDCTCGRRSSTKATHRTSVGSREQI